MTLYLKYRPQNLDELDCLSVRESLGKIVASKKIPHAFLFSGPKGTGKTSAARILAKIINCEGKIPPCNKCEQCVSITKGNNLDVVELDAASHRGIDDARALKDAVKLSPAKAKKKIYIIDEAHMLTSEASNALLKTLEEPPEHVVFILATTNAEKMIDTIRSRTTEILFNKASIEEIKRSLERVIKGEKIKVDPETLDLIAEKSNGSFRDGIKILEQFSLEGTKFLQKTHVSNIDGFLELLLKKDLKALLEVVEQIVEGGVSIEDFTKKILQELHKMLIKDAEDREETIHLIELMLTASRQIVDSPVEELPLEIAIIKWCQEEGGSEERMVISEEKKEEINPAPRRGARVKIDGENIDEDTWKNILGKIRPLNASIEALLRAARPLGFDGKSLTLGVFYKFHKERLEEGHHRKILEEVVESVMGKPIRIICTLTEPPVKAAQEVKSEPVLTTSDVVLTESKDEDIIKVAEEIFGN